MSEEEARYGTGWTGGELDLIVADYFGMLADELAGRPYAKAAHNAALRERVPRSRGSVEFKYQNVSAVLEKLGMPWIPGYKPARHYQGAIAEAISRYVARDPSALDMPAPSPLVPAPEGVFIPPPAPAEPNEQLPASLRRLIAKFDPVERDRRNRSLGRAGEEFVIELERRQLASLGRQDPAYGGSGLPDAQQGLIAGPDGGPSRPALHGLHGASAPAAHSGRSVLHPMPPRRQTAHGVRVL